VILFLVGLLAGASFGIVLGRAWAETREEAKRGES
jgi:hypothetical protein